MKSWHKFLSDLKLTIMHFYYNKKVFLTLIVIFLVSFFSIFRAGYISSDVYKLTFSNNNITSAFNPNVVDIFYIIYNTFLCLVKFFSIIPICQLLSVLILSVCCIMLLYLFSTLEKITFIQIIAVSIIGLTPSYLHLFSYKYNSFIYTFSIFLSIFPIIFYTENTKKYMLISILCNLLSFISSSYMSGIFPIIIIFLAFNLYINNDTKDKMIRLISTSVSSYIIAIAIYYILRSKFGICIPVQDESNMNNIYQSTISMTIVFDILDRIKLNLFNDYCFTWRILILLIILFFIISCIVYSKKNKIMICILILLLLFFVSFIQFGTISYFDFIVLKRILPMHYYSHSISLAIMMLISANFANKRIIIIVPTFILFFCFGIFALSFGNLLCEQKKYDEFKLNAILEDLDNIDFVKKNNLKRLIIDGELAHTPILKHKGIDKDVLYKIISPLDYSSYVYIIEKKYGNNCYVPLKLTGDLNSIVDYYQGDNNIMLSKNEINQLVDYKKTTLYRISTNNMDILRITLYNNASWDK